MPPCAHSISAGRPAALDAAPCPLFHGLLELPKGIAVGCLCLGDFFPHDSGLRSGAARAAMSLHPTRSASPGIPIARFVTLNFSIDRQSDVWSASFGTDQK